MDEPELFNNHQLIFKDEAGKIKVSYHDQILLVFAENNAAIFGEEKSDFFDLLFSENRFVVKKMLIQVTNGNVIPTEDNIWQFFFASNRWRSSAIQQVAYVSEQNIFSKMELEKSQAANISIIRVYRSFNDAYRWITENN